MTKEDEQRQQRLDGSTVKDGPDDDSETEVNDFGEERPYWQTMGGYRRDLVSSLMQKAVRRSDEEIAGWCAWELVRSGFGSNCFNRLLIYLVEDIAAGEEVVLQVPALEQVAREAGLDSRISQVAAIKAARACADAWSSREAAYCDDYLRQVAKLRVEHDDPPYDFPVNPEPTDTEPEARPPAGGQMTFVDDGELEPDVPTNEYGEELREGATYGGFDSDRLLTILDEAIADEDIELASFAAWELTRSRYAEAYWDRIAGLSALYSSPDSLVSPLIAQYETLATDRWSLDGWEGRLCAVHAALTVIRKGVTTDVLDRCRDLHAQAERRVTGDARFPVEPAELDVGKRYCVAADKHTRPGAWAGRDYKHFWLRAGRVGSNGEPDHARRWQRERLRMEADHFREKFRHITEQEIEHALSPVSEDARWAEDRIAPDEELDTFE